VGWEEAEVGRAAGALGITEPGAASGEGPWVLTPGLFGLRGRWGGVWNGSLSTPPKSRFPICDLSSQSFSSLTLEGKREFQSTLNVPTECGGKWQIRPLAMAACVTLSK
jgi:hypothetical protein